MSRATLTHYDQHINEFLRWLDRDHPEVRRLDELTVNHLREYRVALATRPRAGGGTLSPESLHASHRTIRAFLRWAEGDGHTIDPRILQLKGPRLPKKEASLFHINEFSTLLRAADSPVEDIALRLLVGSGVRLSELCGLSLSGPDGMSDLMVDSIDRGRVELRVRCRREGPPHAPRSADAEARRGGEAVRR